MVVNHRLEMQTSVGNTATVLTYVAIGWHLSHALAPKCLTKLQYLSLLMDVTVTITH